jgi:hypothetical protein
MAIFNVDPAVRDPRTQDLLQVGSHGGGCFPRSHHQNTGEARKRIDLLPDSQNILAERNMGGENMVGVCGPKGLSENLLRVPPE